VSFRDVPAADQSDVGSHFTSPRFRPKRHTS
jgi:hypothetical protein